MINKKMIAVLLTAAVTISSMNLLSVFAADQTSDENSVAIVTEDNDSTKALPQYTIVNIPDQIYTGSAITPDISIYEGDTEINSSQYQVEYTDNVLVGVATVTIQFIDSEYQMETSFNIVSKDISNLAVNTLKQMSYTGKAITQSVKVYNGTVQLTEHTDYELVWKNNSNPGKASVAISGKGNYSGTKTVEFIISPANLDKLFLQGKVSSVKLSWSKVLGASGYMIYRYDENKKKYLELKTVTGNSTCKYTDGSLKSGVQYKYMIKAYVAVDGKKYTSSKGTYSKCKTTISKTAVKTGVSYNDSVDLTWNKLQNVSVVEVYQSTSKNKGYKKVASLSGNKTSYTAKNLSSGVTYYYKIRGIVKVNNKKVSGSYSTVYSVKTRSDFRFETTETSILNSVKTSKTNQYKGSNKVMTKSQYQYLNGICGTYISGGISKKALVKNAGSQKFISVSGKKKVSLKKVNVKTLNFSGFHMDQITASVNANITSNKDYVFVRVYYNVAANQTVVYLINGKIA